MLTKEMDMPATAASRDRSAGQLFNDLETVTLVCAVWLSRCRRLLFSGRSWLTVDECDTSSTFTCSSLLTSLDPDEYDEHDMRNPMLGLFCHVQVGVLMET